MASRAEEKQRAREARLAAEQAEQRQARRRTTLVRLGLVVALAAVVVLAAVLVSSPSGDETASSGGGGGGADVAAVFRGIPQDGVTLGDPKAKATLIEFADLQCPFCAEYNNQALADVVKRYVRPGTIDYELRVRGFLGADSVRAAGAAAAAAEQDRLFQFADLFYHRQGEENSGYVTDDLLRGVAQDAGADPGPVVAAAQDGAGQPLVRTAEQKAGDLGSSSTPDFFLRLAGGRLVPVEPQDLTAEAFTAALDEALAQT